jgi:hypothetical protein
MTGDPSAVADRETAPANDDVELLLLVPARQLAALERAAVRAKLTVTALLRRTVGNFLQSAATDGFVETAAPPSGIPEGLQ